jgi:hypothetical protein
VDIRPGDWICFQQLSLPVYGKVDYVTDKLYDNIVTTAGTTSEAHVFEVRRPSTCLLHEENT